MKLAVIGSRNFNNYSLFCKEIKKNYSNIKLIISGGASGADSLAKKYAEENNIDYIEFLPDWNRYGKAAGPIRNHDIVKNADKIIAFWDGKSKGTEQAIYISKNHYKKDIKIIFVK